MGTQYYEHNGLRLSRGNLKLGQDTLILNMGPAQTCPSKLLGHCQLDDTRRCYAAKAERLYPSVLAYRQAQATYWTGSTPGRIIDDFDAILNVRYHGKARYGPIKYLRFNESGDFYSRRCVRKLADISWHLSKFYGITTYGYSAGKDLGLSSITSFLVKGSGHSEGNNGTTISRKLTAGQKQQATVVIDHKTYRVCPGNCRTCSLCKTHNGIDIVIPLH